MTERVEPEPLSISASLGVLRWLAQVEQAARSRAVPPRTVVSVYWTDLRSNRCGWLEACVPGGILKWMGGRQPFMTRCPREGRTQRDRQHNSIQVTLGLMEKPASGASATDAELAALRSCTVGGTKVKLTGDGTLTWAEFDGILPPECLGTDSQRNYNFFVLVDGVEEVSTEENKYLVFNAKEVTTPLGMGCQTTDPMTGALRTGVRH